jgi:transcriptional regulator with XRE-family HTH domain
MLHLREWRLQRKLTLKALEALSGIPFRDLNKYELHHSDPPTHKLPRLARAFGIEIGDLFELPPAMLVSEEPPTPQEPQRV